MKKQQSISVVIATFNEEKNLPGCLASVKGLADEIVVVDGSSTDKTVETAKKYGARIKITTNKQNFHINKQMAIDMATGDWILQLDADERISSDLAEEIKSKVKSQKSKVNGFWIPRKNWFLGRFLMKGGQYPDSTLRLYKRSKGRLPQKDVHEQAIVEGGTGYLKNPLLHYPYRNFSHYLKKWNGYNNFLARQIEEEEKEKSFPAKIIYGFGYLILKPAHWFLTSYIRHKGFMDGWQGFVFSLFSAIRFPASYLKYVGFYKIFVFLILLLAFLLRFYNFPNRWGLGGDDARDAMIASEALRRHEFPLIGSFSSAGPFVFGPAFYYFIMLSYAFLPFIWSPWLATAIVGMITVLVFIYTARIIGGWNFALVVGLLAAVSPQLVVRSLMLGQHSFISFFAVLGVLCFVLLLKTKKEIFSFLMGTSIGLAISFHYQALNLLLLLPAVFFIEKSGLRKKMTLLALAIIGVLIPSLPLIYWDSHQQFANARNILDYFLIGQYRLYVPDSWRLFIFNYFPGYWSFLAGRYLVISFVLFLLTFMFLAYLILKKRARREFLVLGAIFFILIVLNRYYHGERSEGYMLYFSPFIILFSGWVISSLLWPGRVFGTGDKSAAILRTAGVLILAVVMIGNFTTITKEVFLVKSPVGELRSEAAYLDNKYEGKKFSIYDYKYKMYQTSTGLSMILEWEGKISKNGIPLGVYCYGKRCPDSLPIAGSVLGHPLLDLRYSRNFSVKNKDWINVDQVSLYNSLIGWSKKYQLKSTFSLKNYIMNKLRKI